MYIERGRRKQPIHIKSKLKVKEKEMTTEKMTVHKALAELKVIDKRIYNAMEDTTFVNACKNNTDKINGVSVEDYKSSVKSGYQKVIDLINRRNAMKRAVVLSNASTTVSINGVEYTVAEAIDMKNHGMDIKKNLLARMQRDYNVAMNDFSYNSGSALEDKANAYVVNILKSQGDSSDKADPKQIQALHDSYVENNKFMMIDPLCISKKIESLYNEITEFEMEIDSCLSVSNAVTIIEFEY